MSKTKIIDSPDSPLLQELCNQLCELAPELESENAWPEKQLRLCANYGVFAWFLPEEWGGKNWSDVDVVRGYLALSAACLTTTFIITQRMGACRRMAVSEREEPPKRWLPDLLAGEKFATVGISHLTTSRRHLKKPAMLATETNDGFLLNGYSPWVTGGDKAHVVVVGGAFEDGRELLVALPTVTPGVTAAAPTKLVALSPSRTGSINCDNVHIAPEWVLAGPIENVMQSGAGANTGGLQTSTLAIGLADAAIRFMAKEAEKRNDLVKPQQALSREWQTLHDDLLAAAVGNPACPNETLRTRANSLVLRATQAALAAAKGAGYVAGHPAGRWCQEALFFLVWSCPQPVMTANLCEWAGVEA